MPTRLEQTLPAYDFRERHSRFIAAPARDVWAALTTVRLDQLTIARPLVAIRNLGSSHVSLSGPLLTTGPVQLLETVDEAYVVGGAIGRPWRRESDHRPTSSLAEFSQFDEPGWTKFLTDFSVEARDGGVQLTTETRGCSTDDWARHRFRLYWAAIRPASGLIRRDLLATIGRLATATTSR